MRARILIMSMLSSTIMVFVAYFNVNVLIVGQDLGIRLSNFLNIDPYVQLTIAGAGIAYDVMKILFTTVIIIEMVLSNKVINALESLNEFLWKVFNY